MTGLSVLWTCLRVCRASLADLLRKAGSLRIPPERPPSLHSGTVAHSGPDFGRQMTLSDKTSWTSRGCASSLVSLFSEFRGGFQQCAQPYRMWSPHRGFRGNSGNAAPWSPSITTIHVLPDASRSAGNQGTAESLSIIFPFLTLKKQWQNLSVFTARNPVSFLRVTLSHTFSAPLSIFCTTSYATIPLGGRPLWWSIFCTSCSALSAREGPGPSWRHQWGIEFFRILSCVASFSADRQKTLTVARWLAQGFPWGFWWGYFCNVKEYGKYVWEDGEYKRKQMWNDVILALLWCGFDF